MSIHSISGSPLRTTWRNTSGASPVCKPPGSRAAGPKSGKDPNHAFDEDEREAAGHQVPDETTRRGGEGSGDKPGATIDETV